MKIDIKEVAKRAGVSIATVSRVFSNSDAVKPETKAKVLKISRQLNYVPNPIARSLSKQSTETIGVILPDLAGEFFMEIIHGIDEAAYKHNWFVIVSSSHSKRNILETLVEFMGSGRVDGVVLMAPQIDERMNEIIKKSRRPIVFINAGNELKDFVNVKIDNFNSAYNVVEHFIKKHKFNKIGFVEGPSNNFDAIERAKGYYKALADNKIKINGELVHSGEFTVESGYSGFKTLIQGKVKPEAIFFANDMMAVGAYQAAKEMNINIPADIAIAGFDDIILDQFLVPRLTTAHVPTLDLGSKAVTHLIDIIKKKKKKTLMEILPANLVVGGSCGCK